MAWQWRYLVDLRHPEFSVSLNAVLLLLFVAVYLAGDATPASRDATRVASLVLAVAYWTHSLVVMVVLLARGIRVATTGQARHALRRGGSNLWRVGYGGIAMIFSYGLLHAAYLDFDPDGFGGIPPDADRALRLRRGLFLATETSMNLGSGAIIAAPDAEGAYILVALNSVHAYIYDRLVLSLIVSMLAVRVLEGVERVR